MKRDLQRIIKTAVERYGLKYDETQTQPTMRRANGIVEVVSKDKFNQILKKRCCR